MNPGIAARIKLIGYKPLERITGIPEATIRTFAAGRKLHSKEREEVLAKALGFTVLDVHAGPRVITVSVPAGEVRCTLQPGMRYQGRALLYSLARKPVALGTVKAPTIKEMRAKLKAAGNAAKV